MTENRIQKQLDPLITCEILMYRRSPGLETCVKGAVSDNVNTHVWFGTGRALMHTVELGFHRYLEEQVKTFIIEQQSDSVVS